MRKYPVALLLGLLACAGGNEPAPADSDDVTENGLSPEAFFEEVTEAVLAVDAVQYTFHVQGVNVDQGEFPHETTGRAILQRGTSVEDANIRIEFNRISPDGQTGPEEVVVSNPEYAAYLNPAGGNYIYGLIEDGGALIVHQNGFPQAAVLREFLFPVEPFGAELDALGYTELDPEEVSGHDCRVVLVDMGGYESTWWIDTLTMLPVANRISSWADDGRGMEYTIILSDLDTSVTPSQETFHLQCPQGIEPQQVRGSLPVGSQAPDWTLMTPEGGTVTLSDLRGRVVVMDFWATWCIPCRQVMPAMQELHDTYGDDLVVIGVNTWEQADDPAVFLREMGFTYPVVLGGDEVAAEYLVEGIPTFYVIDADGKIAFHAVGADPANEEALREVLGTLLQ